VPVTQQGRLYSDAAQFAADLEANQVAAADQMLAAWTDSYWNVRHELDTLLAKVQAARDAGEALSPAWLYQERRLKSVLDATKVQVSRYATYASQVTERAQTSAIRAAQAHADRLAKRAVAEALPGLEASFINLAPEPLLETLAGFTGDGSVLKAHLARTLPAEAVDGIRKTLVHGLATGKGIDWMTRQATKAYALAHTRAETIMRTEALRVYRETSRRTYAANADVVGGWVWNAHLDARTCIACAVMDGTEHPLDETLDGHPRCRCGMVPRTKTWDELGVPGLEDTRPPIRSGKSWVANQPPSVQRAMMGRRKWEAWKAGDISLDDMVARLDSPDWGTMRTERSLKAIREGRNANWFSGTRTPEAPPSTPPRVKATPEVPAIAPEVPAPVPPPPSTLGTPQSVLDALEPRSWTTATRAKTVEALKATPEGRTLLKVLDSFQSGGSTAIPRLRTDIGKYLAGETLPQGRVDTIETLIRAMADTRTDKDLFRGMSLPGSLDDVLAQYAKGDHMDLHLASFSSDRKLAQSFTIKGAGQKVRTKVNTPVMIEWAGPKSALPIQNLSKSRVFANEKEWLGAGEFRITSVTKAKRGGVDTVVLKVEQVKPLEVYRGPVRPPVKAVPEAPAAPVVENVDALPMPTSPRYSYTALAKFKRDLRGLPDEMVQAQVARNGDEAVEELVRRELVRREAAAPAGAKEAAAKARQEAIDTADEWQAGLPRIQDATGARPVVLSDLPDELVHILKDVDGVRVLGPRQVVVTRNHAQAIAALDDLRTSRREAFLKAFRSGDREAVGERAAMAEVLDTQATIKASDATSVVPEWQRTNPMYRMGVQYETNCTHVCTAYELRMRGFDVKASALPDEFLANQGRSWDAIYQRWTAPAGVRMNDQVLLKGARSTGERWAKAHGEGSRFTVLVRWEGGGGAHVFSAEVRDGQVIYHDAQNGASGDSVAAYLDRAKGGSVAWYRMDNMTPNRDLEDLLEVNR
jgi:SPP1 gp7 family putative phage head morphogenesis protein